MTLANVLQEKNSGPRWNCWDMLVDALCNFRWPKLHGWLVDSLSKQHLSILLGGCLSITQILLMLMLLICQLVLNFFSLLLEVRDLEVHIAHKRVASLPQVHICSHKRPFSASLARVDWLDSAWTAQLFLLHFSFCAYIVVGWNED